MGSLWVNRSLLLWICLKPGHEQASPRHEQDEVESG